MEQAPRHTFAEIRRDRVMTLAIARWLVVFALIVALWLAASEPWGLGAEQLTVFAAPGALLGLGVCWAMYAFDRDRFTWRVAGISAALGALFAPPFLTFLVALDGNARPSRLLAGFIRAAWIALLAGLAVGVTRPWPRLRGRRTADSPETREGGPSHRAP